MELGELISRECVLPCLKVSCKKQVFQEIAARAAQITGLSAVDIFDTLLMREHLGSTGIGSGVAIPHGKLAKLTSIIGLFVRLDSPVDFDSVDGDPVDLVFVLLAPESAGADHLKALARIARFLRRENVPDQLRALRDCEGLFSFLSTPASATAAPALA